MTYLLDTCILSKLRKIRSFPDPILEKWVSKYAPTKFFISALTLAEIQTGISRLDETKKEEKKKKMILEEWLAGELIPRFEGRILPIDKHVSLTWGKMDGESRRKGTVLPLADGLIAATAIANQLIVVTDNIDHFGPSGAEVFSPWLAAKARKKSRV